MTAFRLFVDNTRPHPFVLVTEPLGREIFLNPGEWVDISCDDGAELVVLSDGRLAVHGDRVVVTDANGAERVY